MYPNLYEIISFCYALKILSKIVLCKNVTKIKEFKQWEDISQLWNNIVPFPWSQSYFIPYILLVPFNVYKQWIGLIPNMKQLCSFSMESIIYYYLYFITAFQCVYKKWIDLISFMKLYCYLFHGVNHIFSYTF